MLIMKLDNNLVVFGWMKNDFLKIYWSMCYVSFIYWSKVECYGFKGARKYLMMTKWHYNLGRKGHVFFAL